MLNDNMNFPYPILRENNEDYKKSKFISNVSVNSEENGFRINAEFLVENERIKKLIDDDFVEYALQIECTKTWFRSIETSKNNIIEIFIKSDKLNQKVVLCPCLIVKKNIENYTNDDFSDDYENMFFDIHIGEALAVGKIKYFEANYEKDIINKPASIVNVTYDEKIKNMECYIEYERIQVVLPKEQYKYYIQNSNDENKYPIMNSIVVIPALVQALSIMSKDESDYENYNWYKTIRNKLMKLCSNKDTDYKKMLETPVSTAQILVENISEKALMRLTKYYME